MPQHDSFNFNLPNLPQVDQTNQFDFGGLFQNLPQQPGGNFSFGGGQQPGGQGDWMSSAFGKDGWASNVANAGAGLFGAYSGLKQLGLSEDIFNFNKGVTETNLANQAQTINTQLADRQKARLSSAPTAYATVGDYLDKNRVAGQVGG